MRIKILVIMLSLNWVCCTGEGNEEWSYYFINETQIRGGGDHRIFFILFGTSEMMFPY